MLLEDYFQLLNIERHIIHFVVTNKVQVDLNKYKK